MKDSKQEQSGIGPFYYENIGHLNLVDCKTATLQWSHKRGILENGKIPIQVLKLVSEIGELADNVVKEKCIKDDLGDCLVLITNIAALSGFTVEECWNHALNDIKDRTGRLLPNGNFVKDETIVEDR